MLNSNICKCFLLKIQYRILCYMKMKRYLSFSKLKKVNSVFYKGDFNGLKKYFHKFFNGLIRY